MEKRIMTEKIVVLALICAIAAAGTAYAAVYVSPDSPNIRTSLLRYDPNPVVPGNYVTFLVQVENNGGADAGDVRLKIVPTYPFSIQGNSYVSISNSATQEQLTNDTITDLGVIPSSDYTTVEYTIYVESGVLEGSYPISIWSQPSAGNSWAIGNFSMKVQGLDRLGIQLIPSILTPGKPTDANFVLNNTGTAVMHDIALTWSETANKILPLGSGNTKYVSLLNPGQGASVPFTLIADPTVTSGAYNLIVNVSYTVGFNTTKSTSSNMGVFIGGIADFDVSVQDYATTGTTFTVANIGANPTTSVSVSVPNQPEYLVTGASSVFLGNLNPGDFTLATFQVAATARNRSTGQNPLTIEIAYTDTNGVRQTVDKQVPIQLTSAFGTTTGTTGTSTNQFQRRTSFPVVEIIVVLAAAGIVIYIFRRRIFARFRKKKQ